MSPTWSSAWSLESSSFSASVQRERTDSDSPSVAGRKTLGGSARLGVGERFESDLRAGGGVPAGDAQAGTAFGADRELAGFVVGGREGPTAPFTRKMNAHGQRNNREPSRTHGLIVNEPLGGAKDFGGGVAPRGHKGQPADVGDGCRWRAEDQAAEPGGATGSKQPARIQSGLIQKPDPIKKPAPGESGGAGGVTGPGVLEQVERVERKGVEPSTSALRTQRSTN